MQMITYPPFSFTSLDNYALLGMFTFYNTNLQVAVWTSWIVIAFQFIKKLHYFIDMVYIVIIV